MRYSQEILTQRLQEIQKYLPRFSPNSADYKNLKLKEQDLIQSINVISLASPITKTNRCMRFEQIINLKPRKPKK